MKILKGNFERHLLLDWNLVHAVGVAWVVVWVSRTCQCIVYHRSTCCQAKIKCVIVKKNSISA